MTRLKLHVVNDIIINSQDIPEGPQPQKALLQRGNNDNRLVYVNRQNGVVSFFTKTDQNQFVLLPDGPSKPIGPIEHGLIDLLKRSCPDFADLKDYIERDMYKTAGRWDCRVDGSNKTRIIKGSMQSGKSWVMITMSIWYVTKYRLPVFIVIQNSLHACDQIIKRIYDIFDNYEQELKIILPDKKRTIEELFRVLDAQRGKKASEEQFRAAVSGQEPKIYIVLRSETDIAPINTALTDAEHRYVLLIDESDINDSGSRSDVQLHLQTLKTRAQVVWNITATPLTSLMKEDIEAGNVYCLRKPEHYKDLPMMHFRQLPEPAAYCHRVEDDPIDKDPNLSNYLDDFSRTKPFYCRFWDQKHPRISLIRIGRTVEPQVALAMYIAKHYRDRIVAITYNGGNTGVTIRGKNIPANPIVLSDDRNTTSIYKNGYHRFDHGCHIGFVLQWLMQQGGVKKYPRIVILAGVMADRGITFGVSNYAECRQNRQIPWHLTEMYFVAAPGMNQANLLQASGRLCGVFPDDIPLTIYSNVCKDIIKAYHAQDELIHRARNAFLGKGLMKELIPEIPLSRAKCPGRRFTAVSVPCRIKRVKSDHKAGGWDWNQEGRAVNSVVADFSAGERPDDIIPIRTDEELEQIRLDNQPEKEPEPGAIFTVHPDDLRGQFALVYDRTVELLIPDVWIARKTVIKQLTASYPINTIRSYLTRMQQSVTGRNCSGPGLNFRFKTGRVGNKEVELLYVPVGVPNK